MQSVLWEQRCPGKSMGPEGLLTPPGLGEEGAFKGTNEVQLAPEVAEFEIMG